MTRLTVVHLLRHGAVENPRGVLYERLPGFGLSAVGRDMAAAAATALAGRDVALVRSSPLDRAWQTAEVVAEAFRRDVQLDERLTESSNVFAGRPSGLPRLLADPGAWRHLYNPFRPSWGEPYRQVAARMLAAAADAARDASGREAVLVSHQLPIEVARREVEGRRLWHRPDRRRCALASLTSLRYREGQVVGVSYREPAGPSAAHRPVPPR